MKTSATDPRIDAYIEQAPDYARPILTELRARVRAACPDVVETLKWRTPSFESNGLLGGLAAFKAYCTFAFWKEKLLREDPALAAVLDRCGRMTSAADLPPKAAFAKALRRAAELNASGAKVPRAPARARAAITMHPQFARALAASKAAQARFDAFPPSARREYLEWIADGKRRNWKYEC